MNGHSGTALILLGPTGVGKTALSAAIAALLPIEIVSADSRQIYRYMDIGTAKPSTELRARVCHHFIDILNPDQDYSAGQFAREARPVIGDIFKRHKVPVVVGGSGLYIRALLKGFFGEDIKNPQLRRQLQEHLREVGARELHRELQKIDPASAQKIHPHNTKRVIRALEVFYTAGVPLSRLQEQYHDPAPFKWVKFGLTMERQKLYSLINQRVQEMFDKGLVAEVQNLWKLGYSENLNALNSVGYKEVFDFLKGNINLPACIELVKRNSRRYAKRQLTWFQAEEEVLWFQIQTPEEIPGIAMKIVNAYQSIISKSERH